MVEKKKKRGESNNQLIWIVIAAGLILLIGLATASFLFVGSVQVVSPLETVTPAPFPTMTP